MSGSTTPTANQRLFDATLAAAIDVRRFTSGELKAILELLQEADKDLVLKLRAELAKLGLPVARDRYTYQRLESILSTIRDARAAVLEEVYQRIDGNLRDLGQLQGKREEELLQEAIPIDFVLNEVPIRRLGALVRTTPFEGQVLKDWFATLTQMDQQRLTRAIQIGVTNGETIDQIIQRVVGTRKAFYNDGILSVTRRQAEAIVRTAVNAVSNAAREEVLSENADIISGLRWTSVLDGRTSAICRARDGMVFPVGSGPRPPAHFGCRSVMVAIIDGVALVGDRPYVRDTRRREKREVDFRKQAQEQAGADWKGMSVKDRQAAIRKIRQQWQQDNIGRTPSATTYQEWLSKQPASFQDEVLGPKRGALFRQGGLKLDQFVDRAGRELTLQQLKDLYPSAWAKALGS